MEPKFDASEKKMGGLEKREVDLEVRLTGRIDLLEKDLIKAMIVLAFARTVFGRNYSSNGVRSLFLKWL